jgi:hypothetical protein
MYTPVRICIKCFKSFVSLLHFCVLLHNTTYISRLILGVYPPYRSYQCVHTPICESPCPNLNLHTNSTHYSTCLLYSMAYELIIVHTIQPKKYDTEHCYYRSFKTYGLTFLLCILLYESVTNVSVFGTYYIILVSCYTTNIIVTLIIRSVTPFLQEYIPIICIFL